MLCGGGGVLCILHITAGFVLSGIFTMEHRIDHFLQKTLPCNQMKWLGLGPATKKMIEINSCLLLAYQVACTRLRKSQAASQ
jgi:hypothetical protein